jgi:hypothetical protein
VPRSLYLLVICLWLAACGQPNKTGGFANEIGGLERLPGFYDLYWDEAKGRLIIRVDEHEADFIYQSSLARGVGSNDLGLDRGQLGSTRIVSFQRSGPKILLIEKNLGYRAISDDADEQRTVDESFARSVVWGFDMLGEIRV